MNLELDLINYPVWYTPFTKTLYFKIIFVSVIALLLVAIIFFVLKKRKKKSLPERLIANLEKLKNSNLDDVVFVNSKIVDYLKIYIKESMKMDLFSMSEMEIIEHLKDVDQFKIAEPIFRLTYALKYQSDNYELPAVTESFGGHSRTSARGEPVESISSESEKQFRKISIEKAILFINTCESQNSQNQT